MRADKVSKFLDNVRDTRDIQEIEDMITLLMNGLETYEDTINAYEQCYDKLLESFLKLEEEQAEERITEVIYLSVQYLELEIRLQMYNQPEASILH